MKILGWILTIAGVVGAVALCLLPAEFHTIEQSYSCGVPLRGMFGYPDASGVQFAMGPSLDYANAVCQDKSVAHVALGGVLGGTAGVIGMWLLPRIEAIFPIARFRRLPLRTQVAIKVLVDVASVLAIAAVVLGLWRFV